MAKGIVNLGNKDQPRDEYPKATDGEHIVNGIVEIISKDLEKNPVYVPQNGRMVARLKLRDVTGAEGPVFSATPAEAFALVRAFGGTLPKIDPANRFSSKTLDDIKEAANAGGKSIKVISADGWTNHIKEAQPPDGIYTIKFVGAHRRDRQPGNLAWSEEVYGSNITLSLIFDFEIVGDMLGKPSLWTGFPIGVFVNKANVESYTDSMGDMVQYDQLTYAKSKSGGVPLNVVRFDNFIKAFAPAVYDHDWQNNPTKSPFGVNEVADPQFVVVKAALESNKTAIVHLLANKGGRLSLDLATGIVWPESEAIEMTEETQPTSLYNLITFIEKRWSDLSIFDQTDKTGSDVALTETGVQWAKDFLGGPTGPWSRMTALYPTEDKALGHLSDIQARRLLEELKTQYGETNSEMAW